MMIGNRVSLDTNDTYRKNVFILGAGASVHVGAPLLSNFLPEARRKLDSGELSEEAEERFRSVFDYSAQHEEIEQKAGLNLTNLEQLFGLVDLNVRVEPGLDNIRDNLIFLILRTLEATIQPPPMGQCTMYINGGNQMREKIGITQHFIDIVAGRFRAGAPPHVARDSIISLNYDLVIEQALQSRNYRPVYFISDSEINPGGGRFGVKLLKLHGSANWVTCPVCREITVLDLTLVNTDTLGKTKCKCGSFVSPLIVPPTWSKGENREHLSGVWKAAFSELTTAKRWILIGTSLAPTDYFLKYLFGLALVRNKGLDRIVTLDTNPKVDYCHIFENLAHRVERKPLEGEFKTCVANGELQRYLEYYYAAPDPNW